MNIRVKLDFFMKNLKPLQMYQVDSNQAFTDSSNFNKFKFEEFCLNKQNIKLNNKYKCLILNKLIFSLFKFIF
jgi:hypothetical protein